MYLSDRDIEWEIKRGRLIVEPPSKIDPTSIDLHLDRVEEAKIWDAAGYARVTGKGGVKEPELHLGSFVFDDFAAEYLVAPPPYNRDDLTAKVCLRGGQVIIRPGGFLLWQTKEKVGTPKTDAQLICFVDGKSTKARTGILVHLTAPTIHAGWSGNIVLEIANLGPFTFVLQEGDAIAQLTVAKISSSPQKTQKEAGSLTEGQVEVTGRSRKTRRKGRK